MENEIFEAGSLCKVSNSKTIKICSNQHRYLLWIIFREVFLKFKKGWELHSRPYFSKNFLIIIFLLQYYIKWPISLPQCVYFSSYLVKCISWFMLWHLMTLWHLNIWKVKIFSRMKSFQSEIKNIFHCLNLHNKLVKMKWIQSLSPWIWHDTQTQNS